MLQPELVNNIAEDYYVRFAEDANLNVIFYVKVVAKLNRKQAS